MEIKTVITKKLVSSEGKDFKIGNDIHFFLLRNEKRYDCFGVIKDIGENSFTITDVQIDKMNVSDTLDIKCEEVENGVIHTTDNGYC